MIIFKFYLLFVDGTDYPDDFVQVTRYSLNMNNWTLHEEKKLVNDQDIKNAFEFCNINQNYQGRPYQYAYMVNNYAKTDGSIIKLNVEDGSVIEKLLPDGMFPTGD